MKRFILSSLLCLFVALWAGAGEAYDLKTYVSTNSTGILTDTAISTSTIIPGKCWILGFRVAPDSSSSSCKEPVLSLYDAATTATMSSSTIFDKFETPTGNQLTSDGDWYPGGKKLSNGLAIRQGGYTTVTIFYEQRIQ